MSLSVVPVIFDKLDYKHITCSTDMDSHITFLC